MLRKGGEEMEPIALARAGKRDRIDLVVLHAAEGGGGTDPHFRGVRVRRDRSEALESPSG